MLPRYREIRDAEAVQPVASIGPRATEDVGRTTESALSARRAALPVAGTDGAHEPAAAADSIDVGTPRGDPECAA